MKNKKLNFSRYMGAFITIVVGFVCGLIFVHYNNNIPKDHLWEKLIWPLGMLIVLYLAMLFHMIVHETGHLVFGLLTGYRFSSFRILSFMFIKENRKIKLKKLSIAGTGGQCLMSPPDMIEGKLPVLLYNLGGPIFNFISAIFYLLLFFFFSLHPIIAPGSLIFSLVGFIFTVLNGIPMRMGTVDNDGYNAYSMHNNPEAMRAFWLQMKINESISSGLRLKDMPDDWFYMPDEKSMENSMVAVMGVFYCNRLMDQHRFSDAAQSMDHILQIPSGMVDLHRNMMLCDRLYLEIIGNNDPKLIALIYNDNLRKFMKSMQSFPSIIRTQYAYTKVIEKDTEQSDRLYAKFQKCANTYPYQQEVDAEYEYINLASDTAQ